MGLEGSFEEAVKVQEAARSCTLDNWRGKGFNRVDDCLLKSGAICKHIMHIIIIQFLTEERVLCCRPVYSMT